MVEGNKKKLVFFDFLFFVGFFGCLSGKCMAVVGTPRGW
jgi:hypothetical protein